MGSFSVYCERNQWTERIQEVFLFCAIGDEVEMNDRGKKSWTSPTVCAPILSFLSDLKLICVWTQVKNLFKFFSFWVLWTTEHFHSCRGFPNRPLQAIDCLVARKIRRWPFTMRHFPHDDVRRKAHESTSPRCWESLGLHWIHSIHSSPHHYWERTILFERTGFGCD